MSDLLKVNACVYSRKGCEQEENRDDFYMNGKFLSERNIDNIEASVDHRGSEFFFAVADHMEYSDEEQKMNLSILREIGKFHEKITVQDGDIDYKTRELTTRVTETAKYLKSFHDMNDVPENSPERKMGFAGLLINDGKAVVFTYGSCRVFYCHGGVFKRVSTMQQKAQPLIESGVVGEYSEEMEDIDDFEDIEDNFRVNDRADDIVVSYTEPIELFEGDKFLLISDGIYDTLGEDNIRDILLMRSDSTYIAYRMVNEAMKKECGDDMTAMVVSIERIKSAAAPKKAPLKSKSPEPKNVPPPTYKYRKSSIRKYENIIYYVAVFLTAVLIILILFFFIKNLMKNLSDPGDEVIEPTPIATLTPTPTPEVTPEPTEEPTPTEAPVQEYTVQQGDTLSSIARKFYGDNYIYVEKLGKYNNIPAPYDKIMLGQKIKIPPLDVLLEVE
ncbi:serine/threonine protein phosphatase [Thermoclostridium stercorarium subsp. stercorarium DSM 8532]|uniref:Serine/threonine protein phosphatase n=3 Tax=Thermoclostridium stercorarium TaxID=1510 RepID=L7VM14_THES1|nr:LysM peptidoglycan-binding domain-containing protein [Thermoclostridium stercorarium]AGC67649.1 serine/threonine protein phosphatase [Thermoclostridium stercorarium subsp. stercorarium DSM 8532]AGI38696.1 serine-threonine phosphatase [Thermoclostridium stercorarium subsp. stercorarium DSM 8532]ANW98066.1 serine/threonine protein phosphatase [Thermoclostridium stercorarium subsp. thermolacticum DSM 2910]ANX00610.1 serine/threonine protein phosphatase [Thermoclostridium stercorarium subsp. lep